MKCKALKLRMKGVYWSTWPNPKLRNNTAVCSLWHNAFFFIQPAWWHAWTLVCLPILFPTLVILFPTLVILFPTLVIFFQGMEILFPRHGIFFLGMKIYFFGMKIIFLGMKKNWIISWKKSATCGAIFCVFRVFCVRPPHADFARLCAFAWEIFAHSTEIRRILLRMFMWKSAPSAWDHNAP